MFNLVRGLQKEIDEESDAAPVLQTLKDRAERILKDLENRNTTGLAAMDLLAALAKEKEEAIKAAKDSGLSTRAFGVYLDPQERGSARKAAFRRWKLAQEAETESFASLMRRSMPMNAANYGPRSTAHFSASTRRSAAVSSTLSSRSFSTAIAMRTRKNGRTHLRQRVV